MLTRRKIFAYFGLSGIAALASSKDVVRNISASSADNQIMVDEYDLRHALGVIERMRRENPDKNAVICWASSCTTHARKPNFTISHDAINHDITIRSRGFSA